MKVMWDEVELNKRYASNQDLDDVKDDVAENAQNIETNTSAINALDESKQDKPKHWVKEYEKTFTADDDIKGLEITIENADTKNYKEIMLIATCQGSTSLPAVGAVDGRISAHLGTIINIFTSSCFATSDAKTYFYAHAKVDSENNIDDAWTYKTTRNTQDASNTKQYCIFPNHFNRTWDYVSFIKFSIYVDESHRDVIIPAGTKITVLCR